jgi:NADH-quinone oxidoreductase subunit C
LKPDATHIAKALERAGATVEAVSDADGLGIVVRALPENACVTLEALRDSDHSYTYLVDMFGIDTGEAVDAVYHLRSFTRDEEVYVKAAHTYGSNLASVWSVYPAVLMPERELAEMFGLTLSGHPNPKHLLLTEGIEPLLLKRVAIRTPEEVRNR